MSYFMSTIWNPALVDGAFLIAASVFMLAAVLWVQPRLLPRPRKFRLPNMEDAFRAHLEVRRGYIARIAAAILAGLTIYIGYTSFRTSNKMAALQYISNQSNALFAMEAQSPQVLCVYNWGEQSASTMRAGCDQAFVTKDGRISDSFDNVMLYVEETLLFFIEASEYRRIYQADFYQGLDYWIADASDDWTGAFSYYIVMRETADAEERGQQSIDSLSLACAEALTGVTVENDVDGDGHDEGVCENYSRFLTNLGPASSTVQSGVSCSAGTAAERRQALQQQLAVNSNFCAATWWGTHFAGERIARGVRLSPPASRARNLNRPAGAQPHSYPP